MPYSSSPALGEGCIDVVFKFANHNCRFEGLEGLRELMGAANAMNISRYTPTPPLPRHPHRSSSSSTMETGLDLGQTRLSVFDYGYTRGDEASDGDNSGDGTARPVGSIAATSPLAVTETDLSALDGCRALPQDVPPRALHSSDSHVRRRPGSTQNASASSTRGGAVAADASLVPTSTDALASENAGARRVPQPPPERPNSSPYEYRARVATGAALGVVFHFCMSYLSSRTWSARHPDVDPAREGLVGLRALHGAVQGVKRAAPFAYRGVPRGGWRVERGVVQRAMPKQAAPGLPPIAAPPLPRLPGVPHGAWGGEEEEAGGRRRKRVGTAERIRSRTQRLVAELAEIERQQRERAAQNVGAYSTSGSHDRRHSPLHSIRSNPQAPSPGAAFPEGTAAAAAPHDTRVPLPPAAATRVERRKPSRSKDGTAAGPATAAATTSRSLPSIYARGRAHDGAEGARHLNRTTGNGAGGFMKGPSRTAELIAQIAGPPGVSSPRTPHTPQAPPSVVVQAFTRNVAHRGLFPA